MELNSGDIIYIDSFKDLDTMEKDSSFYCKKHFVHLVGFPNRISKYKGDYYVTHFHYGVVPLDDSCINFEIVDDVRVEEHTEFKKFLEDLKRLGVEKVPKSSVKNLINQMIKNNKKINENLLHKAKDWLGRKFLGFRYNFKPSLSFDRHFGTSISKKYQYPFKLEENDIWKSHYLCTKNKQEHCEKIRKIITNLQEYFPYVDLSTLSYEQKINVLLGMLSNFNEDDIISFSVDEKTGLDDQKSEEIDRLSKDINYDLEWIPSDKTIERIKQQLNIVNNVSESKLKVNFSKKTKNKVLSENTLKNLIKNKFDLDLTGKITMVTNQYQLPILLDKVITPTELNRILNNQGPCYLVEFKNQYYLLAPFRNDDWLVIMRYGWLNPYEFMKVLGIEMLGLTIDDLLDMYFEEEKNLNESYNSDDESDYRILEMVINKSMSKNFDWWKELSIYDLRLAQSRFREGYYIIEGKLRVDNDWGASQWRKYHYSGPFLGNSAWDDKNDYSYIYLGDIIGGEEADEIKQRLLMILNVFYGKTFKDMRFSAIRLYFDEEKNLNESEKQFDEKYFKKIPLAVRRKITIMNSAIEFFLNKVYTVPKICDLYGSYDEFIQVMSETIAERMYNYHFSDLDDMGGEWQNIYNGIMEYVDIVWGDRLEEYFENGCNKEEIINEVRLSNYSDSLFDKVFDKLNLEVENDRGTIYGRWYNEKNEEVFHRNHWGNLWIKDCETYKELRSYSRLFGLDLEGFNKLLVEYINGKYIEQFFNKPVKRVGDEIDCLEQE